MAFKTAAYKRRRDLPGEENSILGRRRCSSGHPIKPAHLGGSIEKLGILMYQKKTSKTQFL